MISGAGLLGWGTAETEGRIHCGCCAVHPSQQKALSLGWQCAPAESSCRTGSGARKGDGGGKE